MVGKETILLLNATKYNVDGSTGMTIYYVIPGDVVAEDDELGAAVVQEHKPGLDMWPQVKAGQVPGYFVADVVSDYKKVSGGRRAKVYVVSGLEFVRSVDWEEGIQAGFDALALGGK